MAQTLSRGPLVNLLGTGAIPPEQERTLRERGIQFATYFESPNGPRCLITSQFADVYQRLGEQLEAIFDESQGLPLRYRVPVTI